jgi:catechol 2,3-dioxygenase-like lactoylglutathione lyase family enzyme
MADAKFTGIHHLKLPVSDLALSREWYERVLGYTVDREFPDDDGVVRGVGGGLPGAGVPVALRQNGEAAAGIAGFDPVSFAIADRAAAEAWVAHFDALGERHSEIRRASRGWVVDVYDPDGLTVRLYSAGDDAEDLTNQPGYATRCKGEDCWPAKAMPPYLISEGHFARMTASRGVDTLTDLRADGRQ